jgi:hypothetical protein
MPTCFPLRQTARQSRGEPSALNVKVIFWRSAALLKLRQAPVADTLRTMHAIALLRNSIFAGVVTAYRRTPRLSSTALRSAVRDLTMLKIPGHCEQA